MSATLEVSEKHIFIAYISKCYEIVNYEKYVLTFLDKYCKINKSLDDKTISKAKLSGSIAQLGEHLPYKQRVIGSSPIVPTTYGLVVQLVRTPPCHGGGRGFESHPGRHLPL